MHGRYTPLLHPNKISIRADIMHVFLLSMIWKIKKESPKMVCFLLDDILFFKESFYFATNLDNFLHIGNKELYFSKYLSTKYSMQLNSLMSLKFHLLWILHEPTAAFRRLFCVLTMSINKVPVCRVGP